MNSDYCKHIFNVPTRLSGYTEYFGTLEVFAVNKSWMEQLNFFRIATFKNILPYIWVSFHHWLIWVSYNHCLTIYDKQEVLWTDKLWSSSLSNMAIK